MRQNWRAVDAASLGRPRVSAHASYHATAMLSFTVVLLDKPLPTMAPCGAVALADMVVAKMCRGFEFDTSL